MLSSKPMLLKIITPEKVIYNEKVNHVVLPAVDGELGIFHHHAPFMSFLKPGRLQIYLQDQRVICLAIKDGLFEYKDDSITILTNDNISPSDIYFEDEAKENT